MITAFIGLPGQGKTLGMVYEGCRALKEGRRVISNVPFTDNVFRTGKRCEYEADIIPRMLRENNALFLIDEASIVLSSYFWKHLTMDQLMRFAQVRKYGLDIMYTSQGWKHTIKRLRDLTSYAVVCKNTRLAFSYEWMDPEYFDRPFVPTQFKKDFIVRRTTIPFFQKKKVFDSYNTLNVVQTAFVDRNVAQEPVQNTNDRYPSF